MQFQTKTQNINFTYNLVLFSTVLFLPHRRRP